MAQLLPGSGSYLGIALIIANDYRNTKGFHPLYGTHNDAQSLQRSLQSLHFKCSVLFDVRAADFARELDDFVCSRVPACCKYVLFAFCGHGDDRALFAQDGKRLDVEQVTKKFDADQMAHLAGKVRLLLIDACKGDLKDYGVAVQVDLRGGEVNSRGGEVVPHIMLPRGANVLVACSTLPGYVSQEVKEEGHLSKSVWMPILAEEIARMNASLMDVLVTVNRRMLEYSTLLGEKNPKIFPQIHCITVNTLLTPVNLVKEAEMFQQWLFASEYGAWHMSAW